MRSRISRGIERGWKAIVVLTLLGGYWLLPISGQVIVMPADTSPSLLWPQMRLASSAVRPGEMALMKVTDVAPWANVLLTVEGQPVPVDTWQANAGGTWTWQWRWVVSGAVADVRGEGVPIVFYHDCQTGCVERGRTVIGNADQKPPTSAPPAQGLPTKLGVVFANPERDWYGRSGWDVELTYARLPEEAYWGVDDLAARVGKAAKKGVRVLVRVDYDRGQSLPPANDQLALATYLRYLQRLARDDRLREVYGYVIGSGFNALDSNTLAPEHPVTPAWYARLFNGYGETVARTDNVVQTIRGENAQVRILVGPVRPWNQDQTGERRYRIDVPWLNYMNSLVAALDEATRLKAMAGIAQTGPDGFALQAPGRPAAPELAGRPAIEEPRLDLPRAEWNGAQAGFRVYRDWLGIINSYSTTSQLPVYITAANTFAPDEGTPPAQNYPRGWLTTALDAINGELQVQALAWFMDGLPGDSQWEWFSLSRQSGRMIDAAEEWNALLRR